MTRRLIRSASSLLRGIGLQTGVRAGRLDEEMLLVAQVFAGGAVEDPVLLPFVQHLEAFEQHDGAGGGADQEGRRRLEAGDMPVFGEDRQEDRKRHDRDFEIL